MESCKKGREVIGLGPVPLEGDSEEKRDFTGRDLSWGVSSSSHMLGVPAQGSGTGKLSFFAGWRAGGPHRRPVGSLDFACELWACTSLLLKQGGEGRLKTEEKAAAFPHIPYCMPRPEPSEHTSPAYYLLMMKCQNQKTQEQSCLKLHQKE